MSWAVIDKAIRKIQQSKVKKGINHYTILSPKKYELEYGKYRNRYYKNMWFFDLYHYGTHTCRVITHMNIFGISLSEVIYINGWGSRTDITSISKFMRYLEAPGIVGKDYFIDKYRRVYNYGKIKYNNYDIEKTLLHVTKHYSENIQSFYKLKNRIRTDTIIKFIKEQVKEYKEREIVNAI